DAIDLCAATSPRRFHPCLVMLVEELGESDVGRRLAFRNLYTQCRLGAPLVRLFASVCKRNFVDAPKRQPASIWQLHSPRVNTGGSRAKHKARYLRIAEVRQVLRRLIPNATDKLG